MENKIWVAGLDLSSEKQAYYGKTVATLFSIEKEIPCWEGTLSLKNNQELISFLRMPWKKVGVDAPLSLPPCLRCSVTKEENCCLWQTLEKGWNLPQGSMFHYRFVDILWRKLLPSVLPKPAISNGGPIDITPLTMRMLYLQKIFSQEVGSETPLLEVYVSACAFVFADVLGMKLKKGQSLKRSGVLRFELLQRMFQANWFLCREQGLEEISQNDDWFDSFVAGLCACFSFLKKELKWYSFLEDGKFPPPYSQEKWFHKMDRVFWDSMMKKESLCFFLPDPR